MFTIYNPKLGEIAKNVFDLNRRYFFERGIDATTLADYQLVNFKETLAYVKANSPFYKKHLEKISDKFIGEFEFDRIQALPFTDKSTLRSEMFDMLSKPVDECCFFYETTGTTGRVTPCPRDYVDTIYNNMAITSCLSTILQKPGKKHIVGVCGPTELHSFGDTLGDVCKNMGLAIAKMWPYSPVIGIKRGIESLHELKISALMCTPGMALTLAKFAKEFGYDPRKDFSLEIIMLTGELGSPEMMRNIENIWGAKAYNFLYGSQEALVIGTVVENKKMHTFPINYYYEVIDPITLEPVPKSDGHLEGELVVTMLFQGSKPLVRYRTGDMVRLWDAGPDDIFPSPTLEVLGRTGDALLLNGQVVQAYDLENLLMGQVDLSLGYQIAIYNDGKDKLDIQLEMLNSEDGKEDVKAKIIGVFRERLGTDVSVSFNPLGAITTTGAMVSWKAARIIDRREKKSEEKIKAEQIAGNRDKVLSVS